jgi:phenylacetate-CoA ligase
MRRTGPGTGRREAIRALRAQRRFGREDYQRFQGERLRRLVRHAYDRVPLYRRLYQKAGLDPDSVRGLEDLERIPVISKEDMRNLPVEDLVASGVDKGRLIARRTSGSTGEPFVIRRLRGESRVATAHRTNALRRLGMRATDKLAIISFVTSVLEGPRPPLLLLLNMLGRHRYMLVHCAKPLEEIAAALIEGRPRVIIGQAAVLSRLAETRVVEELRNLGVRFVAPGGQVLTDPMRNAIAETFRAPVYNRFAAYEFGTIAVECPQTHGLHVCDGNVLGEVLNEGRPVAEGERGEFVGTALGVFSAPYIRYRIGDLVTRGPVPCQCGAPMTTIGGVLGREADYVTLPDGRMIHPFELNDPFLQDGIAWVLRHQVIQERRDFLRLRYVERRPPTEQELGLLKRQMRETLGEDVELQLERVKELGLDGSGKFPTVVSKVRSFYGEDGASLAEG